MMHQHQVNPTRRAFTLIEILVVLAIITLLAAIMFPVFRTAREKARQTSCASNLQQIYLAVQLYHQDEGEYPPNLAALLSEDDVLAGGETYPGAKGYFKGGKDALICDDDDTEDPADGLRSSYGDVGNHGDATDFGNYIWNYWGYRVDQGDCGDSDVSGCGGTAYGEGEVTDEFGTGDPKTFINVDYGTQLAENPAFTISGTSDLDITKLPRLANRFAPPSTIITHCVYHRIATTNLGENYDLYNDDKGNGAKDIILRLDGSVKTIDVSGADWADATNWSQQRF